MTAPQTLADQAVEVLAAVKGITEGLSVEDADRHVLRDLKRQAEAVLADAFRTAQGLAYTADAIRELRQKGGAA